MTESKVFVGKPEKVEQAFNHWAADVSAAARQVVSVFPFHCEPGHVGLMIIFNTAEPVKNGIVPIHGTVN